MLAEGIFCVVKKINHNVTLSRIYKSTTFVNCDSILKDSSSRFSGFFLHAIYMDRSGIEHESPDYRQSL